MDRSTTGDSPVKGVAGTAHEIVPDKGTFRRVKDGEPLDRVAPWDYPVAAECAPCGRPVRKEESLFGRWEHTG
jgi:hypothetical protein